MRLPIVFRYIGMILLLNSIFMLISAGVSLIYGMDTAFYPLLLSAALTAALGAFPLLFVEKSEQIYNKEGYAIVVGAWIMACFVGMFPYLLWGGEFNISVAWFESVSGFTTTGASALTDVEALPHGLLFWRSLTHWLGGIGVVMFVLVIIPTLGKTKMTLTSFEMSPLAKENYPYKAQKLASILLVVYLTFTLSETLILKLVGMEWFDSITNSFSTIATGGFTVRNKSIGHYDSLVIEGVIMFFMALSGVHFGLIYATFTGKRRNIFRSEVTRFYIATFMIAGLLIAYNLWDNQVYGTFGESLRSGLFHSISSITTTGFSIADTTLWPPLSVLIIFMLMIQCACAGSTSGGIKSDRILLTIKVLWARILKQQHPNAVIRVRLNGATQEETFIGYSLLFIVVYLFLIFVGSIVVAAAGYDLTTSFSMSVASIGNIGVGFGEVGPTSSFAVATPFIKVFCSIYMLLGRLEIFGLLHLLFIRWWR